MNAQEQAKPNYVVSLAGNVGFCTDSPGGQGDDKKSGRLYFNSEITYLCKKRLKWISFQEN
jgi:hypothetical protein